MRDILFRGKRKLGNEWIEGALHTEKFTDDEEFLCCEVCQCDVYPETVGQYTGLTDKNGKKIFEGDIVAGVLWWLEQPKYGVVTFRDGSFGLLWYRGKAEQFNPFASMCNIQYEVVGNIIDNKDFYESEVIK